MSVSERTKKGMAEGSWIRRMFEEGIELKARLGEDKVFDLSLGNPIMEPPEQFNIELKKLANKPVPGMHRYMENAGYPETRAAVAKALSDETGLKFDQNDVIMTCGAAGALNSVLKTILDPGQEILVFAPYFVEYFNYVDNHFGVTRALPTDNEFQPNMDVLEASITEKTRGVIVNSPNNPSGAIYSERVLKQMGRILTKKEKQFDTQIYLISDEPYRKIIYDGLEMPSLFHCYQRSILCNSHSKDLGLPGERIGYAAIHPDCEQKTELMNGFIYCNRILGFVNAPALMQHVVRNLQNASVDVADYQKKRDFLYNNLTRMGYKVFKPKGAFYMFPKTPATDDVAFIRELLEYGVLVVPGRGFGTPGYFRISFCTTDKVLEGALDGLRQVAKKHGLS